MASSSATRTDRCSSNFENAIGVAADVRDRNVFGRGMSMSLGGRYEADLASVRALFSVPTLGSRRIRTKVYWSWLDVTENASDGSTHDSVTHSALIEQRWLPRRWMEMSWGYTISDRRFDLQSVATRSTVDSDGILASLNAAVILDRRDNVSDTKRGWFHSSSVQRGDPLVGSDLQYSRYLGRAFVDAFLMDYAVYPALSRLYVTHHSFEPEQSQKLSVIQDTTWTPQWLFLPLVVKNQ